MRKLNIEFFAILALIIVLLVMATAIFTFRADIRFLLRGYAALLFGCFVFYPMFWNSVLKTAAVAVKKLIAIIPRTFSFTQAKFRGKGALFIFLYHVRNGCLC